MQPGGTYAGFLFAISPDVVWLAESAAIDTTTTILSVNQVATAELINLLGSTLDLDGGRIYTTGYLNEIVDFPPRCPCQQASGFGITPQLNRAGLTIGPLAIDAPGVYSITGLMLYRSVPEPSTAINAFGVLIYLFVRCRNSQFRRAETVSDSHGHRFRS